MVTDSSIQWSDHWSFNFRHDPKRLAFVLARYNFPARLATKGRSVLELGCSDGIGATMLAEEATDYTGVDLDQHALETAKKNLSSDKFTFLYDDFMGKKYGDFQTVVSLDVVEHIYPESEAIYFETIAKNLTNDGIAVVGTPNITSAPYASEASQMGHVNLFSQERLKETLERYFHTVFPFSMNDETIHTGHPPMAHYVMCMACNKRGM